MTPLQLARAECANFKPNGSCLGMNFSNDGKHRLLYPEKNSEHCTLADEKPCRYFEEAVLAGIPTIRDEREMNRWQDVEDQYEAMKEEHERKQKLGLGEGDMAGTSTRRIVRAQERTDSPVASERDASTTNTNRSIRRIVRRHTQLDQIAAARQRIR